MKQILFIILTVLLFSNQYGYSQEIPEGAIMLDKNTIIKDESGNKVEMLKLMELMNSGDWTMAPVNDSNGKLLYMQLRKTTEEEKKQMAKMPKRINSSKLIGKSAPTFKMKDINGNIISKENTKGKVVVLNFWFTSCKPCISEIPELNEVYEKYKSDTNVVFASVTFNKLEEVNSFLKKYPIKYPVVANAQEMCDLFKISGYPTNIVIDKDGNYFNFIIGGFPKIGHLISSSIQNTLEGKTPVLDSLPSSGTMKEINPNLTFMLENGKVIPFEKAKELLKSKNYDMQLKMDKKGNEYYLLKSKI